MVEDFSLKNIKKIKSVLFWLDCTSDLSSSWKTDTLDIGVRVPGSPKIPKVAPPPPLTGYLPDG